MTNLYKRLVNWYGENKQARKVERKRRRERRKRESFLNENLHEEEEESFLHINTVECNEKRV